MFKKLLSVNWLVHELTMHCMIWLITSWFVSKLWRELCKQLEVVFLAQVENFWLASRLSHTFQIRWDRRICKLRRCECGTIEQLNSNLRAFFIYHVTTPLNAFTAFYLTNNW